MMTLKTLLWALSAANPGLWTLGQLTRGYPGVQGDDGGRVSAYQ
jgi:hypothetical protein